MKKVKILHIVSSLSIGSGVMGIIMNIYRNIDREKVQFDFMYFIENSDSHLSEIESLGGRCFKINRPSPKFIFFRELNQFFENNAQDYTAIHNHEVYINFLFYPIAKKHGIENVIIHSHTTMYSDRRLSSIRNRLFCIPIKKQADHYFACSKAAGQFLYGGKYFNKKEVNIVNNAIDCEKFKFNENQSILLKKQFGLENKLVIGHIGRFNEQKKSQFLN